MTHRQKIPKVIHTVSDLCRDDILTFYPDFEMEIWSLEHIRMLIQFQYPWFLETFDKYDSDDKRELSGMYFILYTHGGLYINSRVKPVRRITDDYLDQQMFLGCLPPPVNCKTNCETMYKETCKAMCKAKWSIMMDVIACKAGHNFWEYIFDILKQNDKKKCNSDLDSSIGWLAVSRMVEILPCSIKDVSLIEPGVLYPSCFAYEKDNDSSGVNLMHHPCQNQDDEKDNSNDSVVVSILARNKAHVLPLFLECIEQIDYQKCKIHLYIHTNDNNDETETILRRWLSKCFLEYASYNLIVAEEEMLEGDKSGAHLWGENRKRLDVLARIRQKSLKYALSLECGYYFVIDCDNFVLPHTLKSLIALDKPIVCPVLHCIGDPYFSNFFVNQVVSGWKDDKDYSSIVSMENRGVHKVHIAHCTYLVNTKYISKLSYIGESGGEWEFLNFSFSANRNKIGQYADNSTYYGLFLHFWGTAENEKYLFEVALERVRECLSKMKTTEPNDHKKILKRLSYFQVNKENIQ